MKNTPKLVHISEPLWRALEVMSEQMGVDKDALVNQAVYALARMHGFITPPQVKVNDEAAHALDPMPEPMPSVKPGPPVPTPPEPPPTVPERGPMPSPPTMAMPAPTMSAPPPPPQAILPVPATAAKPETPQGPSETERAELRAKATETMKAIAAEVERIVAVQADPPIGEEGDDDEDQDDEQDEAESEEPDGPAEKQREAAGSEDDDDDDDASEAPSEQNAAAGSGEPVDEPSDGSGDVGEEEDEADAPAPNTQAELQSDLESLGLGEGEEPKSDLSPLPELPDDEQPRDEPEGIPTALVRPNDAVGHAATALRPKHKKGDDSAGLTTMGVHVNLPDRPDGAEEINVTGTVRRLGLQMRSEREEDEPQERTQIVRKEKPRLFIIRGGADPIEIVSERYLIGRGPHCDMVIESNRVSREHAAVFNDDEDGFVVEDLGSSNGTWFKEERVQKHIISDGDEVFFGNEAVRFTLQAPGASAKRGARRDGRVQA